jgi:hypothetical protein
VGVFDDFDEGGAGRIIVGVRAGCWLEPPIGLAEESAVWHVLPLSESQVAWARVVLLDAAPLVMGAEMFVWCAGQVWWPLSGAVACEVDHCEDTFLVVDAQPWLPAVFGPEHQEVL